MSGYRQRERKVRVAREAANWLLALQDAPVSDADRAEFIDWLRESSLHVAELLHACSLQRSLGAFGKWRQIEMLAQGQGAEVVTLTPLTTRASIPPRRGRAAALGRWLRSRGGLAAAAGIAAVVVGAAILSVQAGHRVITTQAGERREVTLTDGSVVDLAPDSQVRVHLRAAQRLVSLDRGEVLFRVAHNPRRPFIVTAADTQVRAVGTAFDVRRGATGGVAVTVVEGIVRVTTQPSAERGSRERPPVSDGQRATPGGRRTAAGVALSLAAGEQVVIAPATGTAGPVRQVQAGAEVAWVTNQLNFDNEPVAEVARSFNRYNRIQIKVIDQTLAARRVSGSFRTTDPESFVQFIQSVAGVSVVHQGADVIMLGQRASAAGAVASH